MKSTDELKIQFEKYRISRSKDKRCWILEEFQKGGLTPKTREIAPDKWVEIGYWGRLDHLVTALVNRAIPIPVGTLEMQLKGILEELKRVEASLLSQMKEIK